MNSYLPPLFFGLGVMIVYALYHISGQLSVIAGTLSRIEVRAKALQGQSDY